MKKPKLNSIEGCRASELIRGAKIQIDAKKTQRTYDALMAGRIPMEKVTDFKTGKPVESMLRVQEIFEDENGPIAVRRRALAKARED